MRSFAAPETFAGAQSSEDKRLDGAPATMPGKVVEQGIPQPADRRAARGVLIGILLGVGAWGAIWFLASALLRHRG
ncbi:MAG: hypothetical protein WBL61_05440 [Bryobacteraceae bacterium]